LPGLTISNEFISRDEGLHTDFACLLYSKLKNPLSAKEAEALMREAVEIEKAFIIDALRASLWKAKTTSLLKRVSSYALAGVGKSAEEMSFKMDADF
jgi:hypothetical protein